MQPDYPAKLLRIHISERDRFADKPLYEAIVTRCRERKIAGATVFRGLSGYGESAEMHKPHLGRHDQPIVIVIVDAAENIDRLIPALEEMMDTALMAVSGVRVTRIQKAPARAVEFE